MSNSSAANISAQLPYQPVTTTTSGTTTGVTINHPSSLTYTPIASGITILPYNNPSNSYYYTTTTNSISIKQDYDVFKLPKRKMPEMVYVNGRLVTLGIFGSDVDCAYNGSGKLIFSPNILNCNNYTEYKIAVSLIYKDEIYHYNVEYTSFGVQKEEGTKVIKAKLLSVIKREE